MNKDLKKQFLDDLIKESVRLEIQRADLSIVSKDSFKNLRNHLKLSQSKMADIIGVSKKTIEKWEQGANPIQGAAARLIYLIMDDNSIMDRLYSKRLINKEQALWTTKTGEIKQKIINITIKKDIEDLEYPKGHNEYFKQKNEESFICQKNKIDQRLLC